MPPRARAAERRRLTWAEDRELCLVPQLRDDHAGDRNDHADDRREVGAYRSAFDSEPGRYEEWLVRASASWPGAWPFGWLAYEATDAELRQASPYAPRETLGLMGGLALRCDRYDLVAEQGDRSERLLRANSPRPNPRCMPESDNPCSLCTGAESEVRTDRVATDARVGTRCQPGPNRSDAAPLGKPEHGQRRDPPRRPRERTLDMLSSTVLAIAGTGYGLIGLLVIIVLVLLIIRLV
jgi:hypothetical protein